MKKGLVLFTRGEARRSDIGGPHLTYVPHIRANAIEIKGNENQRAIHKRRPPRIERTIDTNHKDSNKIDDKEATSSHLELQQVIDHLKLVSRQRRQPVRVDRGAAKEQGLQGYGDYVQGVKATPKGEASDFNSI